MASMSSWMLIRTHNCHPYIITNDISKFKLSGGSQRIEWSTSNHRHDGTLDGIQCLQYLVSNCIFWQEPLPFFVKIKKCFPPTELSSFSGEYLKDQCLCKNRVWYVLNQGILRSFILQAICQFNFSFTASNGRKYFHWGKEYQDRRRKWGLA